MGEKGQVFVPVFLSGRLSKAVEFSYDVGGTGTILLSGADSN